MANTVRKLWQTVHEQCLPNARLTALGKTLFANFGKLFMNSVCQTGFGNHVTLVKRTLRGVMEVMSRTENLREPLTEGETAVATDLIRGTTTVEVPGRFDPDK